MAHRKRMRPTVLGFVSGLFVGGVLAVLILTASANSGTGCAGECGSDYVGPLAVMLFFAAMGAAFGFSLAREKGKEG